MFTKSVWNSQSLSARILQYSSNVDSVALEDCICHEVRVANEWYLRNRMIVNETKHQAIILGRTGHSPFFSIKRFFEYIWNKY